MTFCKMEVRPHLIKCLFNQLQSFIPQNKSKIEEIICEYSTIINRPSN